jgi:hypothetical protein
MPPNKVAVETRHLTQFQIEIADKDQKFANFSNEKEKNPDKERSPDRERAHPEKEP